ncbi:MAG: DUF4416 family protein [Candidatus Brocadiales bacterium]
MGEIKEPRSVNLIIGMLTSIEELFDVTGAALEKEFGAIDLKSDIIPFNFTDYYRAEMGSNLQRRFFGFDKLIMPDSLADIKLWTNRFEEGQSTLPSQEGRWRGVSRPINLDPGYISEAKLVLASTKDFSHRIYLTKGIYAEVTLKYLNSGRYESLPWTFPGYRTQQYQQFFLKVRGRYREKLKGLP